MTAPDYDEIALKLLTNWDIRDRALRRDITTELRAADKAGAERTREAAASLIEHFGGPLEYARNIRALSTEPPA